jgi:hypothetical protein
MEDPSRNPLRASGAADALDAVDQILLANPQLYHSADGKPLTQKNQGGNVLNLVVPH